MTDNNMPELTLTPDSDTAKAAPELVLGGEAAQERRQQAEKLVRALEGGDELALFEASMLLERAPKEELSRLLDQLYLQLGERLVETAQRERLLKAAALVRRLRGAAELNANPGQLAGWLCGEMFL